MARGRHHAVGIEPIRSPIGREHQAAGWVDRGVRGGKQRLLRTAHASAPPRRERRRPHACLVKHPPGLSVRRRRLTQARKDAGRDSIELAAVRRQATISCEQQVDRKLEFRCRVTAVAFRSGACSGNRREPTPDRLSRRACSCVLRLIKARLGRGLLCAGRRTAPKPRSAKPRPRRQTRPTSVHAIVRAARPRSGDVLFHTRSFGRNGDRRFGCLLKETACESELDVPKAWGKEFA